MEKMTVKKNFIKEEIVKHNGGVIVIQVGVFILKGTVKVEIFAEITFH